MFIKIILCYSVVVATLSLPPSQVDLTGIKCVVEGERAAIQSAAADYKNGKVYLSSDHCADAFKKDAEEPDDAKFAIKANHQLVLTGQYVQKGCPITGEAVDENLSMTLGAVKIGFSSAASQAKIDQLETFEEKATLLFSDAAFDIAFAPRKVVELAGTIETGMPGQEVAGKVDATEGDQKSELVAERPVEKASTKK